MAGKPPNNPDILTLLLGKIGIVPAQKKAKKGKRRRPPGAPPAEGLTPLPGPDVMPGDPGASPFAAWSQAPGLMGTPEPAPPFGVDTGYQAAAAAGYAPQAPQAQPPSHTIPGAQPGRNPDLPRFGADAPEPSAPAHQPAHHPPAPHQPVAPEPPAPDGRMFSAEAIDTSLDALFSGLETGLTPTPPPAPPPAPVFTPPPAPTPGEGRVYKASELAASGAIVEPLFDDLGLGPALPVGLGDAPLLDLGDPGAAVWPPRPTPPAQIPAPTGREAPIPANDPEPYTARQAAGFRLPAPTILTLSQGQDLRGLLAAIDRLPGVAGTLLVGYDGLLILTTLAPGHEGIDRDFLGAQACNLFSGNRHQLTKIQQGELRRIILETGSGAMLMTAADMGILVVVSQEGHTLDVAAVMAAIAGVLGTV